MSLRQDRLFFFQFPAPFPSFKSIPSQTSQPKKVKFADEADVDMEDNSDDPTTKAAATPKVSTSAATSQKPTDKGKAKEVPEEQKQVDGVIGQLEVYRSGAVKMRLGNGILLEV
jgi:DNA-directed RNA polymerase III subunit RPC4